MLVPDREQSNRLVCCWSMFGTRSLDDLRYFHERAEQSRRAAQRATDPGARVAHEQLAKFYEARLASTMETAALQNSGTLY